MRIFSRRGGQAIDTGYCANPNTGVTADFAFTSATPTQQKVFGADVDNGQDPDNRCFSFSTYINGSGYYAWACKDGVGNWTPYDGDNSNSEAKAVVTAALLHQWQTPPEPVPPSGRRIVREDTQGNM